MRTIKTLVAALLVAALASPRPASSSDLDGGPLILHGASANREQVVFSTAGFLWQVPRGGGTATRLSTEPFRGDSYPHHSPDGRWIAFSRSTAGNADVYVMPAHGGEARRLTYNPKTDRVRGWTADGDGVLFASARDGDGIWRLYTIGREEVWPRALPLPEGVFASFAPDGESLAYIPWTWGFESGAYRYYRGGLTSPLWVADLASSEVQEIGSAEANHRYPMWRDGTLYFVSDRSGTANLYSHDLDGKETTQLTSFRGRGIRSASLVAGRDEILLVRGGRLYLRDLGSSSLTPVPVTVPKVTDEGQAKEVAAQDFLTAAKLSPAGDGLLISARGEVILHSLDNGKSVNLSGTSGAAEREATLSPDGKRVAWFSDRSGEYRLVVGSVPGDDGDGGRTQSIELAIEDQPTFYREPHFSPDGRFLAFSGKRLGLWLADLETRAIQKIDRSDYLAQELWHPSWSPDGRYVAYAKASPAHFRSIVLYDRQLGEHHTISPPRLDATQPVFDPGGKYLYFLGSHNAPLAAATNIWGLLSAEILATIVTRKIYVVPLAEDQPAPQLPLVAEPHPAAGLTEEATTQADRPTHIDVADISSRAVALPLRARAYEELATGGKGVLLVRYRAWPETPGNSRGSRAPLYRYDLAKHDWRELADDVDSFSITADGDKLLYSQGDDLLLGEIDAEAEASAVDLAGLTLQVDPAAEWQQIFDEALRMMRDVFYDPGHHGVDLEALRKDFSPYLPNIQRRQELTHLLREMLGQVSISHMSIFGGDVRRGGPERERIGLLGAEYEIDRGRYRMTKIYRPRRGDANHPVISAAPLGQPGILVEPGDYLLAVDDREITADKNLYQQLAGTSGRPIRLRVGSNPEGDGSRELVVVPIGGVNTLKRADWFEQNRRKVAELSGGRLAYVVARDFGFGAIEEFIGQVVTQSDREGWIIDQRFGPGGTTSDFLLHLLTAPPLHQYAFPYGQDLTVPNTQPRGPKVLLINRHNGSASETFPQMFKLARAGTIVGTRTGGAGTGGALHYPRLIDGGRLTIPNRASYDPVAGQWLENEGVSPDVEVDWPPAAWRRGEDPQLERAVAIALEQLSETPAPRAKRPSYPVHPSYGEPPN